MRAKATAALYLILGGVVRGVSADCTPVPTAPPDPDVSALMAIAARRHYTTAPSSVIQCLNADQQTWWIIGMPYRNPAKPPAVITYMPGSITRLVIRKSPRVMYVFTPAASWRIRTDAAGNALKSRLLDPNGWPMVPL